MDARRVPLFAIQAFVASCQFENFTRAAAALGMSQSAVTRHISALEHRLGVQLFDRGPWGVTLTDQGRAYLQEIRPALEAIVAASNRIHGQSTGAPVRLLVYQSFAVRWLAPRLAELRQWAPDLNIEFQNFDLPEDPVRAGLDAAIYFGDGKWSGYDASFLMGDLIEPVCSPTLAGRSRLAPEALCDHLLLGVWNRLTDWQDWREAVTDVRGGRFNMIELPNSTMAFKAAEAGVGMAIGQIALLRDELERGVLIRPFQRPVSRTTLGFYLLLPAGRAPCSRIRKLKAWLVDALEADAQSQSLPRLLSETAAQV